MRFLPTVVLGLVGAGVLASSASADSIVYARDGDLFLISADGARGYQVTHDGGYSSPSQAADGTIGAVRGGRLVRMDRSGRRIGKPVDAIGGPGSLPGIAGPYDARISPDGRRFAYWFYVQIATNIPYDPEHRVAIDTGSHTTWTWADRFTDATTEAGNVPDLLNCAAATDRVIAPGGTEPAFGPADVVFPRSTATLRKVWLRPHVLRRGARATLRFTSSARTLVRVNDGAGRVRGVVAHRGVNRLVIRPRRASLGRHRLRITPAHGRTKSISYRVVR